MATMAMGPAQARMQPEEMSCSHVYAEVEQTFPFVIKAIPAVQSLRLNN